MLRRIVVLAVVALGSFVLVPTSSAALESFTTTLEGKVLFVDGNCCGIVFSTSGRVRGHDIPGVRPGTFEADLFEGTFDREVVGNPKWMQLAYTARGGKGTLRLATPFPRDESNSFKWEVTEATGIYAGWTGSGTYSYEFTWFDPAPEEGPVGEVLLTLTGEIGPS